MRICVESWSLIENAAMSNKRRQFSGNRRCAIAVPATSSLVLAQGNPAREGGADTGTNKRPGKRSAKSELTGLSLC